MKYVLSDTYMLPRYNFSCKICSTLWFRSSNLNNNKEDFPLFFLGITCTAGRNYLCRLEEGKMMPAFSLFISAHAFSSCDIFIVICFNINILPKIMPKAQIC